MYDKNTRSVIGIEVAKTPRMHRTRARIGAAFIGWMAMGAIVGGGLVGCADVDLSTEESDATSARASLKDASFTQPLTKELVAGTHTLSADRFDAKWRASIADGPLMFLRAYPAAFHLDLKQLPLERIPGEEGLCVGDAHPDNFGYLEIGTARGRSSIYAFNDLDDSGRCLVALDALRYFVAFRLYFDDDAKLEKSLDDYIGVAFAKGASSALDLAWKDAKGDAPNWSKVQAGELKKYVSGDAFKSLSPDELQPVSSEEKAAVIKVLSRSPSPKGIQIFDVARRPRVGGGSGGLTRYWAYVALPDGAHTILELKETARPGVDFGHVSEPLSSDERLGVLKRELWGATIGDDYFPVQIGKTSFLVRDRARKESENPNGKLRRAQARYLGALHHGHWADATKGEARDWLKNSSKVVAKRWVSFYESQASR